MLLRTERPPLVDGFGRVAHKLRISVTDRCNFRCNFCMPTHPILIPHDELLTYEEITRIASVLASMGVGRIRLTGGEPLARRGVESLVAMLSRVPGVNSLSMTTNGFFLA